MKTPISIRFPLVKEKTGYRKGPRFRRVPDKAGLHGAASCVVSMLHSSIIHRDSAARPWVTLKVDQYRQIERAGMRLAALWARVFAGQIDQHDPRIDAASAEHSRLVAIYCGYAA